VCRPDVPFAGEILSKDIAPTETSPLQSKAEFKSRQLFAVSHCFALERGRSGTLQSLLYIYISKALKSDLAMRFNCVRKIGATGFPGPGGQT
jgi:hypothetical protein